MHCKKTKMAIVLLSLWSFLCLGLHSSASTNHRIFSYTFLKSPSAILSNPKFSFGWHTWQYFNYKQPTWRKTQIRKFDVRTPHNFNILGDPQYLSQSR